MKPKAEILITNRANMGIDDGHTIIDVLMDLENFGSNGDVSAPLLSPLPVTISNFPVKKRFNFTKPLAYNGKTGIYKLMV